VKPARTARAGPAARGESGSTLLAAVILLAAATATSAAMLANAAGVAAELRARRDVLCARYAALGGLALGATATHAAAFVGPDVEALEVSLVLLAPGWCVRRATATCGIATRRLDGPALDPSACAVPPPPSPLAQGS
jgi:hypothetical protein